MSVCDFELNDSRILFTKRSNCCSVECFNRPKTKLQRREIILSNHSMRMRVT